MSKGISTDHRVTNHVGCLSQNGIRFVCRYYSNTTNYPEKRLTSAEAAALVQAGIQIVTVYEDGPTTAAYFSRARGLQDAAHAHAAAQQLPQPAGSAIYFAVDYDANPTATNGPITDYFGGLKDGLAQAGGGTASYQIGVYGSGRVCQRIKEQMQLARYSWLAESTGWAGSGNYPTWNIKQAVVNHELCGLAAGDYEDNQGTGDFGAFPTAAIAGAAGGMAIPAVIAGGGGANGGGAGTTQYALELVRIARQQYDGFHQFTESDGPLRAQIRKYWEDLDFDFPGIDTAWSAVFVSWCVHTAGASTGEFKPSTAHSRFVFRAIQNQMSGIGVFRARRIEDYRPKVGDILHNNRGNQNVTYDFAAAHEAYESHSAVVVEVGADFIRTVGGNESDSVGLKRVDLTADGFVKQRHPNPYICIIENLKV